MKKSTKKIIEIIFIIGIILTISIFAYRANKKENYSFESKHFGSSHPILTSYSVLEQKRIKYSNFLASITKTPADLKAKDIYFSKIVNENSLSVSNAPPTPSAGNMIGNKDSNGNILSYNFEKISDDSSLLKWSPFPNKNAEEMRALKADKKADDYLKAIDDAEASAVSGILNALYGAFKEGWTQDAALELAKQVGIGLLKIGLACMGLGFINAGLDALFGGGSTPAPIDYDKIASIVGNEVQKGQIREYGRNVNIQIANVNDFIKTYTDLKYSAAQAVCPDSYNTLSKNIDCMKTPNYRNHDLKYDPNIVFNDTGTTDGKTKRQFLLDTLRNNNAIHNMVTNSQYGINGLIEYGKISVVASAELYSQFLLVIGLTIVYYQELSMVDTENINGKYVNPWFSRYIGDPNPITIGGPQIAGSLIGELQSICQKLFDYIKNAYISFWNSIYYTTHCDGCNNPFVSSDEWWEVPFQQGLFPNGWFERYRIAFPQCAAPPSLFGNPHTHWANNTQNFEIVRWWLMHCFNEYMNNPLATLQVLKKMAGIDTLKGELGFTWGNPLSPSNSPTTYNPYGGFPFGSSNYSYKEVVVEKTILDFNKNNVYCSRTLKLEKDKICPQNPDMFSTKPIDGRIFNVPGGQQFSDNMSCPPGYGEIVSCLKPRMSPGNNKGEIEQDSRQTWCKKSNGVFKPLIPYKQFDLSEDVCIPEVDKCGYGTPVPKLPIKVSSRVFNVRIRFFMNKYNLQLIFVVTDDQKEILHMRDIVAYRCTYQGKESYNISKILAPILKYFGFKSEYPYLNSYVELVVSALKPPSDPGTVNNTTRPPVNVDCQIVGYDYVKVKNAFFAESNGLVLTLEIKGEDI